MALSFTSSGSTPLKLPTFNTSASSGGATPQAKALSTAQSAMGSVPLKTNASTYTPPPPIPAPATPVKKTTVNNVDGSSHVTEYHAPEPGLLSQLDDIKKQALALKTSVDNESNSSQNNGLTFPGMVGDLANAAKNSTVVSDAQKRLSDFQKAEGEQQANVYGEPGLASFKTGRAGALQEANAEIENKLAQGVTQAQTSQGQEITGLTNAATALHPELGSIGQVPYLPGENSQGAVLGSTQPGGVTAAGNLLGQLQGAQAAGAAPGQAQAANTQALGTATTSGVASVLGSLPALKSANTAAEGIASTINSFLAQNPQLNASNSTLANAAQQWIQGKQLADPNYQILFNNLSEYSNTLAPILGVGGDATNLKTQIAQGFINARANGQSISQVLAGIGKLASDKIANIESGATGGGVVTGNTGGDTSFATTW